MINKYHQYENIILPIPFHMVTLYDFFKKVTNVLSYDFVEIDAT